MPVSHVLTKETVEMRDIVIVLMTFTKMTVLVSTMRTNLPKTSDQLISSKFYYIFSKCSQIY